MSSSVAHRVARDPASQPVFPDEILEEIFIRLEAAADLARASAACTTFRRVVSARRFLRRFRSLHPPPALGILETRPAAFSPAEPPHGAASASRALAQAADFTLSFIDAPKSWQVCDARDGRLLLRRRVAVTAGLADLMVCLHRRYIQLPPIPDDLAAATRTQWYQVFDPFLDAATDDDEESFRVIYAVHCRLKLVTIHFSSVSRKWTVATFNRTTPVNDLKTASTGIFVRNYAHGCFYWKFPRIGSLFILNPREMSLSVVDCPPNDFSKDPMSQAIVELGSGRLGLINLWGEGAFGNPMEHCYIELCYKTLQNNGVGTDVWQYREKMILLPDMEMECRWNILDVAGGYVLLQATPAELFNHNTYCFTMDLKTLLFKRLCVSHYIENTKLYASFPPPLSLPSI